jgi:hypothetical protein
MKICKHFVYLKDKIRFSIGTSPFLESSLLVLDQSQANLFGIR